MSKRIYFMDVIGAHEDDIEEVLVGCRECTHRSVVLTLGEAQLWVHDHHEEMHDKYTPSGVDMIGDKPLVELGPRRDQSKDWEIVSKALEEGNGFITAPDVCKLLNAPYHSVNRALREWDKAGKIVLSGRVNHNASYCRTEDTHLYEEARLIGILADGPVSLPNICKKLGYTQTVSRINEMVKAMIEAGTMVKIGSGPATVYQLLTT